LNLTAAEYVFLLDLELQQKKRQLADAILSADNALIRNLQREDLELLLS
jgi:hypothetical protein